MEFIIIIALVGLLIGSFLNVVIWRLPQMLFQGYRDECYRYLQDSELLIAQKEIITPQPEPHLSQVNLVKPRSFCPHCRTPIRVIDNIPVISFLLLRGRCRTCKSAISWRYPLIELLTMILSAVVAFYFGPTIKMAAALLLTWALIALTFIDYDHQLLPDDITLPFLWLGLLVNVQGMFVPLQDAVIGAAVGYLFLWSVYWLFKLITGKEGMGYGDFKLIAMLGAWCGWQTLPLLVLISAGLGTIFGIGAILFRKIARNQPIPYGPFLAVGGWVVLVYHTTLVPWLYTKVFPL